MEYKDVMLQWQDPNIIEKGYRVYKSNAPFDMNNLPPAISELQKNSTTYTDKNQIIGNVNYYMVSAWIDGTEKFSNQIMLEVANKPSATGGIESVIEINGTYYKLHAFKNTGTSSISFTREGDIDVLIVGGGGGGSGGVSGDYWGSGGGGSEVIWESLKVSNGNYDVYVGTGGASATSASQSGYDGTNSNAFGKIARAGKGGRSYRSTGGSSGNGFTGGIGTSTSSPNRGGGGGGGATQNGSNGGSIGGNGGDGRDMSLFIGTNIGDSGWFGGGGAGYNGDNQRGGIGGKGGGASPTSSSGSNSSGQPNTGGGAGERDGRGGSGIVVVRYEINQSEYQNF